MKYLTIKKSLKYIGVMLVILMIPNVFQAQEFNLVNSESSLKVYGTSSLHDWHVNAENMSGKIIFNDKSIAQVSSCDFKVVSESLKSGKGAMDKNTYKALKTDKHKTITYKLVNVKDVIDKGSGKFMLKTTGNLTIVGVTKPVSIDFYMEIQNDKIILSGETAMKMTTFGIQPPTALFGTVTTGNDLTIKFKNIYK